MSLYSALLSHFLKSLATFYTKEMAHSDTLNNEMCLVNGFFCSFNVLDDDFP